MPHDRMYILGGGPLDTTVVNYIRLIGEEAKSGADWDFKPVKKAVDLAFDFRVVI